MNVFSAMDAAKFLTDRNLAWCVVKTDSGMVISSGNVHAEACYDREVKQCMLYVLEQFALRVKHDFPAFAVCKEPVELLPSSGVKCLVCDKSISLETAEHFSAQYYSPACKNAAESPKIVNKCNCCGKEGDLLTDEGLCSKCNSRFVINNLDDAAAFLNLNGDWAVVCPKTNRVLEAGIMPFSAFKYDKSILFVDRDLVHKLPKTSNRLVPVPLDHLKPTITQAVKGETGADTIKARESVYGPFEVHAEAEQDILEAVQKQPGWAKLNKVQKSAMQMIVHKMARILNNSADYDDNWHDISGYATLAEKDIKNRKSVKPD